MNPLTWPSVLVQVQASRAPVDFFLSNEVNNNRVSGRNLGFDLIFFLGSSLRDVSLI